MRFLVIWEQICPMGQASAKAFAAIVPVLVISFCLNVMLTDLYYSLDPADLSNSADINSQVVDFLRGKGDLPDVFEPKEKEHMEDVKELMDSFFWMASVLFIAEIILLMHILRKGSLRSALRYSSVSTWGLSILLVFGAFFFDPMFRLFHKLFFEPGSWIFEPTDIIVNIYPKDYFIQGFLLILVGLAVFGLMSIIACKWLDLIKTYLIQADR